MLWLVLLSGECIKWANLDTQQQKLFSASQLFLTAGIGFLVVLTAIYKWVKLDQMALVECPLQHGNAWRSSRCHSIIINLCSSCTCTAACLRLYICQSRMFTAHSPEVCTLMGLA